jgi:hypothetical protein
MRRLLPILLPVLFAKPAAASCHLIEIVEIFLGTAGYAVAVGAATVTREDVPHGSVAGRQGLEDLLQARYTRR